MQLPLWVLTGIAAATLLGGQTAYQKQAVTAGSPLTVSFYTNAFALPFLLVAAIAFGAYTLPLTTFLPLSLSIVANIIGVYLLVSALDADDVGIVGALRSFQPVVIAVVEPLLFAAEAYAAATLLAAVLAVVGAYVLLVEDDLKTPLTRIDDAGPRLAFASVFAYAAAILLDRFALATTSVSRTLYPLLLTAGVALGVAVVLLTQGNREKLTRVSRDTVALGAFRAGVVFFGIITLSLTTGARASILFQLSSVISVGIGTYFFSEEYVGKRFVGAVILVLSVAIAVSGGF